MAVNANSTKESRPKKTKFQTEDYDDVPVNQRGAIRILKVDPGPPNQPAVYCELICGTILSEKDYLPGEKSKRPVPFRSYDALSWCWGTVAADDQIHIKKGDRMLVKGVQHDLVKALRALRHETETKYIWVDAVCINQEHGPEKNVQVEMMAEIYGRADCVRIWLGDSDPSSDTAIRFIKEQILQLQHFDELTQNTDNSGNWEALLKLMQRNWFSRRWVVQEVTLAQRAMIHCGSAKIAWRKFAIAVELFVEVESATHRLSEVMKEDSKYKHIPREFEYISHLGASLLVDATGKLFREYDYLHQKQKENRAKKRVQKTVAPNMVLQYDSEDDEDLTDTDPSSVGDDTRVKGQPLLTLEYLVSSMAIFDVTNPHDSIYALLGIAKDTTPTAVKKRLRVYDHTQAALEMFTAKKQYPVDYEADYIDICQEFIEFCVQQNVRRDPSRALDVICRPWAVEDPRTAELEAKGIMVFPSWLPQLDRASYGMDRAPGIGGLRMGRKNADSLVGLPNVTHRNYNAAETKPLDTKTFRFRRRMKTESVQRGSVASNTVLSQMNSEPASSSSSRLPHAGDSAQPAQTLKPVQGSNHSDANEMLTATSNGAGSVKGTTNGVTNGSFQQNGRSNQEEEIQVEKKPNPTAEEKAALTKSPTLQAAPVVDHVSLYVKGFILDTVTSLQTASQSGSIPTAWANFAGWDMEGTPPEYFWRTLVADRGSDGKNPPVYYAKACQESFRKGGKISGVVETAGLIEYERNSVVAQFCRRVQSSIWNRALVKTKSERLGLVSKDVRKNDLICILYGCSVPVVLRKRDPKSEDVIKKEMEGEIQYIVTHVQRSYRTHLERRELFRKKREADKQKYEDWEDGMRERWRKDKEWRAHWELVRSGLVRVHEFRAWFLKKRLINLQGDGRKSELQLARGMVKVLLSKIHEIARWAATNKIAPAPDKTMIEYVIAPDPKFSALDALKPSDAQIQLWKGFQDDQVSAKIWKDENERYLEDRGFIAWARADPGKRKYGYRKDKLESQLKWKEPEHRQWTEEWAAENSWFLCIDSFRGWLREKAKWVAWQEDIDAWEKDKDWHDNQAKDMSSEDSFNSWSERRDKWKNDKAWHAARTREGKSSTFPDWRDKDRGDTNFARHVDPERAAFQGWIEEWKGRNPHGTLAEERKAWLDAWAEIQEKKAADEHQAEKLEENIDKEDKKKFFERWRDEFRPNVMNWDEFHLALTFGRHWLKLIRRHKQDHIGDEEIRWKRRKAIRIRQDIRRSYLRDQYGYQTSEDQPDISKVVSRANTDLSTREQSESTDKPQDEGSGPPIHQRQDPENDHSADAGAHDESTTIISPSASHSQPSGIAPISENVEDERESAEESFSIAGDVASSQTGKGSADDEEGSLEHSPPASRTTKGAEKYQSVMSPRSSQGDHLLRRGRAMTEFPETEEQAEEDDRGKWEDLHDEMMEQVTFDSREDLLKCIKTKKRRCPQLWDTTRAKVDEQYKIYDMALPRTLVRAGTYHRDFARPKVVDISKAELDDDEDDDIEEDPKAKQKRIEEVENEDAFRSKKKHFFAYRERSRLSELGAKRYMKKVEENFEEQSGDDAKFWYEMLGECYVHGMMDGEAMKHQNDEGILSTVFEIR